jgi:hypothetical protein
MFSVFRAKVAASIALIFAAMSIYIKILRKKSNEKSEKIRELRQNAEIQARRSKDDSKRAKFESTQQTRSGRVSNNDTIDVLDKNRGKVNDKDGFTTITR